MTWLKRRLGGLSLWRGGEVMLVAERFLCPLGRYDDGDGGPPLLQRRWGGTSKKSFSVVLLTALTVLMMKMIEIFPSVPFGGILTTVVLLNPAVPPKINTR